MAQNPQLFGNGMPVPFVGEMFVLARDGVEFAVDKIPGASGGHVKAKGTIYLSNIRMVFVAKQPVGNLVAFDMPLGYPIPTNEADKSNSLLKLRRAIDNRDKFLLFVHGEKFNQPVFFCNNIAGFVEPVVPEGQHRALYSTHSFKIMFKEGGCGTFVPLFLNLVASVRRYNQHTGYPTSDAVPSVDPLQAAQTPVEDMMRRAYVDPNDPTKIFLQQPAGESQLRRRAYHSQAPENSY